MKKKYKYTKTTVSFVTYHLVFCPRYRRKIFSIPGVHERFTELTLEKCSSCKIEVLSMECHIDHVYMKVSAYPQQSISDVVKQIKGATSNKLREEFPELKNMPYLWTRSYFVSTEDHIPTEIIEWYVGMQKTRD